MAKKFEAKHSKNADAFVVLATRNRTVVYLSEIEERAKGVAEYLNEKCITMGVAD